MTANNRKANRLTAILAGAALLLSIFVTRIPVMASASVESAGAVQEKESAVPVQEKEASGGSDAEEKDIAEDVDAVMEKMTLREKVGQMMIPAFSTWSSRSDDEEGDAEPFTKMNETVRETIAQSRLGGVILFGENFSGDMGETMRLISDMQSANQDTDKECRIPLLIAVDQEGGVVNRLSQGTGWPGSMALAAAGDPDLAGTAGVSIGKELSLMGINTDFAPVMDVNSNPNNPVIGVRSFSDDPGTVSGYGMAFMKGLSESGTIACLKHFSGHGDTDTDSHVGLPSVNKTLEELRECELIPFREAIDAGAEMIMTAHIQHPAIEKGTCVSKETKEEVFLPDTMSEAVLTDLLRGELGFEGVVVTDSLQMDAVSSHFEEEDVWRLSINAGADMLLIPVAVTDADTASELVETIDKITKMAEKGTISRDRIDASVRRILTLKARHGLLAPRDFGISREEIDRVKGQIGSPEEAAEAWETAERSLTLLKNDRDTLPLSLEEKEKVLVLYPGQSRILTAEYARKRLEEEKKIPDKTEWEELVYGPDTIEECLQAAREADHVVAVSLMFSAPELDPRIEDGESGMALDRIISEVHKDGGRIIMISAWLPYDAARFQEADAIIACYGSTWMTALPEEGQLFDPGLPAAIWSVFGGSEPEGRLPVNLMKLDEDYQFTDEILYPSGFSCSSQQTP